MWLCRLGSWATLVFEIGFPLAMLFRWLRTPWLLAGVGLHLGILVTIDVGWFSQATLCWYAVFLSPEHCDSLYRGLQRMFVWNRWHRPSDEGDQGAEDDQGAQCRVGP